MWCKHAHLVHFLGWAPLPKEALMDDQKPFHEAGILGMLLEWCQKWFCFGTNYFDWAVLSGEQMSKGWPFSLLNDEQMSNWLGVEHQPVDDL